MAPDTFAPTRTARIMSGASAGVLFQKVMPMRPSVSCNTCDGKLHDTSSYPFGSTTALRLMPSGRLKTIVSPRRK